MNAATFNTSRSMFAIDGSGGGGGIIVPPTIGIGGSLLSQPPSKSPPAHRTRARSHSRWRVVLKRESSGRRYPVICPSFSSRAQKTHGFYVLLGWCVTDGLNRPAGGDPAQC